MNHVLPIVCISDYQNKQVHTTDLQSRKETIFDYDSLVISTGARTVVPNLTLDKNMSKIVERELADNSVKIILGERVEEILDKD
jgi:NADH dehydrogenase FAD-containing subunit